MCAVIRRWNTEVLPCWEVTRGTWWVKDMVYDGIPPAVREQVWARAVGNDLNITPDYYQILRQQAKVAEAAARRASLGVWTICGGRLCNE